MKPFDPKRAVKLWLLVLVLAVASPYTAYASFLIIIWYSTTSRAAALCALAMSWSMAMLNPGLAVEAPGANFLRFLVLAMAAVSVGLRRRATPRRGRASRQVVYAVYLGAALILHSLALSSYVAVSVLKALSWTVAVVTSVSAWQQLTRPEREAVMDVLYTGLRILLVASIPLLVVGPGYLTNGTGFQGVMGHPQAFGPTMALLAVLAFERVLRADKMPWADFAVLGISLVFIFKSEARTAAGSLIIGLSTGFIVTMARGGRGLRTASGMRGGRYVAPVVVGTILAALLTAVAAPDKIESFIAKRGDTGASVSDAFERSRGELVDEMLENIDQNFWTGIGFGVASDPSEMTVLYDPVLGLPVSAVVEKGVMPLAILEETGFFGAALVALWILNILWTAARGGFLPIAVVATAFALNLGEDILFSPGGMGMIIIILIGWATTQERAK